MPLIGVPLAVAGCLAAVLALRAPRDSEVADVHEMGEELSAEPDDDLQLPDRVARLLPRIAIPTAKSLARRISSG